MQYCYSWIACARSFSNGVRPPLPSPPSLLLAQGGEIAVLERMIMEGVIPTDQLLIEMHDWQGNGDHTERIDALVCGIKKLGFESVFARPPHEYTFIRIAKRGAPRVPQRNPRISARSNTNHWGGSKPKPLTPGEVLQRMTPQTVS